MRAHYRGTLSDGSGLQASQSVPSARIVAAAASVDHYRDVLQVFVLATPTERELRRPVRNVSDPHREEQQSPLTSIPRGMNVKGFASRNKVRICSFFCTRSSVSESQFAMLIGFSSHWSSTMPFLLGLVLQVLLSPFRRFRDGVED